MATTRFRMDPEQTEALSRELDGLYRADFSAIVAALQAIDGRLDQAWAGGSRAAFQAQFGGWLRATEPLGLSLVHVAHFLRAAAAEYRRLDAALAERDLVSDRQRPHTGSTSGGLPPGWDALLPTLPGWQVAILNTLLDLWQRGLPSPFVRVVGGGGGIGASAGRVAIDLPDWLQAIIDFFTGGHADDPIPEPQVNNLCDDGCVTTDEDGNVLYNLVCSPPEPQAESSFLEWLFGTGQAPLAPGGPLVDVPILVPGQGQDNDDDESGGGRGSSGGGPRGGGAGDDILDDLTRPLAGNGNRIPETIEEARLRVGNERFDALAWDPEAGRMRENEALVAVDLEARGALPGPMVRADVRGVDYIDSTGRQWDIKGWQSHQPNGYDLNKAIAAVQEEIALGESIIIDTRNMSPEHVHELNQAIAIRGLADFVIWWP